MIETLDPVRCYAKRLLNPFQGVIQVIAIEHAEAETTDGINWVLYVFHEDIVSHTGMSEIRYGSWNRKEGLQLSMVRGTESNNFIDVLGERITDALIEHADTVPFTLNDCYECWLLSEDGQLLALLDTVDHEDKKRSFDGSTWQPCKSDTEAFISPFGDTDSLKKLIRTRAGSDLRTVWVRREISEFGYTGDAVKDDGEIIPASEIPQRLLLESWINSDDSNLVKDYLAWQAPWLLQLDSYDNETRRTIETQAWKRPLLCARQFNLFTKVLDAKNLNAVRVQARLMGYDGHNHIVIEPFVNTGDKDNYNP